MFNELLINFSTILAMVPVAIFGVQKRVSPNATYWFLLWVSVLGPLTTLIIKSSDAWHTDLSTSIWATITATMLLFSATSLLVKESWRLVSLVSGYMIILGIMACFLDTNNSKALISGAHYNLWIGLHIFMSIATYGLLTIAAISAFSAAIQEYSLKAKIRNPLYGLLPSITDCDKISVKLLVLSEIILGIGLISGIGLSYVKYQQFFVFNHKSILTITAFIVIAILLIAHFRVGIRGQRAARFVLCAYLLMTLGYPGVKFVSDIILK